MSTMRVTCPDCGGGHYSSTCTNRPKAVAAR
jgi:hypothetical protein